MLRMTPPTCGNKGALDGAERSVQQVARSYLLGLDITPPNGGCHTNPPIAACSFSLAASTLSCSSNRWA